MGQFVSSMEEFISENRNYKKYVPSIESFLTEMARQNILTKQGIDAYILGAERYDNNDGELIDGNKPLMIGDTGYKVVFLDCRQDQMDLKKDSEEVEEESVFNKTAGLSMIADEFGNADVLIDIDVEIISPDDDISYQHNIYYIKQENKEEEYAENSIGKIIVTPASISGGTKENQLNLDISKEKHFLKYDYKGRKEFVYGKEIICDESMMTDDKLDVRKVLYDFYYNAIQNQQ